MFAVGIPSSAEPRPKPFTIGPETGMGYGGWGMGGPTGERERAVVLDGGGEDEVGIVRERVGWWGGGVEGGRGEREGW